MEGGEQRINMERTHMSAEIRMNGRGAARCDCAGPLQRLLGEHEAKGVERRVHRGDAGQGVLDHFDGRELLRADRLGKVDLGLSALHFAHIIEREGEQRFLAIRIIASRFVQMLQNGGCTDALQVVTKRGRR